VKATGSNVTGLQGDVAKLADFDRLYETIKAKGRIDIVFANAGLAEFSPLVPLFGNTMTYFKGRIGSSV
jgi:NAD(P)-dependent dehydrogenase (short-subunit alcohol dehydrogenase family)